MILDNTFRAMKHGNILELMNKMLILNLILGHVYFVSVNKIHQKHTPGKLYTATTLSRRLRDVVTTSSQRRRDVVATSSRRRRDAVATPLRRQRTPSRRRHDVVATSSRRRRDVVATSSRRLEKKVSLVGFVTKPNVTKQIRHGHMISPQKRQCLRKKDKMKIKRRRP